MTLQTAKPKKSSPTPWKERLQSGSFLSAVGLAFAVVWSALTFWLFPQYMQNRSGFPAVMYRTEKGICGISPDGKGEAFCPELLINHPVPVPDGDWLIGQELNSRQQTEAPSGGKRFIIAADKRGKVLKRIIGSEGFEPFIVSADGQWLYAFDTQSLQEPAQLRIGRWFWPNGTLTLVPVKGLQVRSTINAFALSPNGKLAVIVVDNGTMLQVAEVGNEIWTIQGQIATSLLMSGSPAWLDNGRLLVLARQITDYSVSWKFWEIDIIQNTQRQLPSSELELAGEMALSPDGKTVVATVREPKHPERQSLWRVELDGQTPPKQLTYGPSDSMPVWDK